MNRALSRADCARNALREETEVVLLHLKSLELQGFKSFPDKTQLTFGDGITAIVGPNGSGKSNISDAVRWVLGEQSTKTLRGSKMEDVIFGGTEKRGAVGYAEVSLTIDNSDGVLPTEYNEVTITRRYYRSGDSEFYINRQVVRLRDIHELLMDTGLGRDGYSIIGQGRIDEILSLKSEDRREIFEEAAGISKFRHRKEEAERRLGATEENLIRIRDIITELAAQVEPLEAQAADARRFLQIHDELRGLEVDLWMHQLDRSRESLGKLQNDYQIACAQFERGKMTVDELYAEAERLAGAMRDKDAEIEQARERNFAAQNEKNEQQHEISVLQNTIENHNENIKRIAEELSEGKNRAGGLEAQLLERRAREEELAQQEASCIAETERLEHEIAQTAHSSDDAAAALQALQAERAEVEHALSDEQIRRSALITALSAHTERCEELAKQKSAQEQAEATARARREELARAKREAEETVASAGNILAGVALKQKKREEKCRAATDALAQQNGKYQALEHKLRLLRDMERDLEGFSHAVKLIHRAGERGELRGIRGTVAKLVRVPGEYTLAIETILGGALQHVVVEDERAAKAGISLLKSANGGRATFLPLTTIRGNVLRERDLASQEGFVGLASDLVSFEEEYRAVFENLLGRAVVVDHIDHASALARAFGYRFRVVTLDGQVVNAGGSYTGGSAGRSAGILSRASEIERLEQECKALSETLARLTEEKSEAEREAAKLRYDAEVYENDKRQAEDALLRAETELGHCRELLSAAQEAGEALACELDEEKNKQTERNTELAQLNETIAAHEKERAQLDEKIDALMRGHDELARERGALTDKLSEQRSRIAAVRAERAELARALAELSALHDALAGDHERDRRLIEEYEEKKRALQQEIEARTAGIAAYDERIAQIEKEIAELSEQKLALEAQRNRKDKESKDKNDEILNLERERARLEGKISGAENEERQITDKLWETYELTITAAEALRRPIENMGELTARVSRLKGEKKKLGNVNLGAIEEYERVSERYGFLSAQRDDLETAKAELTEKIGDITAQMRDIFAAQFAVINKNFGETFAEIFGGGKAELSLDDPEDILQCGIEIRVQPPGKSLRTITLLSGGERAFVAIALYFAIMKVRPTPFCVLDEIEAALDDVNVVRYANYLRKLTATTQFIVITHRRGTMEEADVLYGVTMQEQGVSKMLTISIAEVERELHMKLK